MTWSDKEIWEGIKNNNKKLFELLFHKYFDSLCLYSHSLVKNKEVAEEIVNDVFLKIWQKRGQIQIIHGIKPYLFRSVYNASNDYFRQNSSLITFSEIDDQICEIIGTDEEYIFDSLQIEKVQTDVLEAVNKLPEQCKVIFCLSRFDLLTYNEISERLNISVNTVKTQISRALDSLREQLGRYL